MDKQHYNLYYIFQMDYAEHPMPPNRMHQVQKILLGLQSSGEATTKRNTGPELRPP